MISILTLYFIREIKMHKSNLCFCSCGGRRRKGFSSNIGLDTDNDD